MASCSLSSGVLDCRSGIRLMLGVCTCAAAEPATSATVAANNTAPKILIFRSPNVLSAPRYGLTPGLFKQLRRSFPSLLPYNGGHIQARKHAATDSGIRHRRGATHPGRGLCT